MARDIEKIRAARRRWYYKNKVKARTAVTKRRKEITSYINEIKSKLHCINCKENHVACLDFHHRNPDEKDFTIATAMLHGYKKDKILEEIAKCDVLCANCHRKLHWTEK